MSTDCAITVVHENSAMAEQVCQDVLALIDELEQLWSRFRSNSDIGKLNNANGAWVQVDQRTIEILQQAQDAWRLTSGLFDISMLQVLEQLGYDRDFSRVSPRREFRVQRTDAVSGMTSIEIDVMNSSVRVRDGIKIDLGGCGKGRIADLVTSQFGPLVDGMSLDLGGDIRVTGSSSTESLQPWEVKIADPFTDQPVQSIVLADGAVASSSVLKRRWQIGDETFHHLVDPVRATSSDSSIVSATVIANEAIWADIFAKVLVIRDDEWVIDLVREFGLTAVLTTVENEKQYLGDFAQWAAVTA